MAKNDGGPAFPLHAVEGSHYAEYGMSLRDYFAAKALTGMLASSETFSVDKDTKAVTPNHFSKLAYMFSDSMLAAREAK